MNTKGKRIVRLVQSRGTNRLDQAAHELMLQLRHRGIDVGHSTAVLSLAASIAVFEGEPNFGSVEELAMRA